MKARLWLLAWISTTFAIETRRLKINLNEEVLIGSEIANLKTELNFGKDRVFSLQTPSDIFQLRYSNLTNKYITPSHWSLFLKNFGKKSLPLPRNLHLKSPPCTAAWCFTHHKAVCLSAN